MNIDVSIIFVNYKTSNLIADSIKSIVEHVKEIVYEFVIVDNNSEKDLDKKFSGIIPSSIHTEYLYLKDNIGFGRANNEGAKVAQGKYLFLLNPDTLLLNNAIKILYDFLETHPRVKVCGGNLYDRDNNPVFSFRKIFPGPDWEFQELTRHMLRYPQNIKKRFFNFSGHPMPVAYVSGADLMISADTFKECKGFPEDLFMYWDDVELCKRVKDLGYEVYSVPEAKVCHLESRSFENVTQKTTFKIELQEKYRFVYLRRNAGKFKNSLANIIYFLYLISRSSTLPKGSKKDFYKIRKSFFLKFLRSN